jgi:ECF transporter S component (folate family)
VLGRIAAIYVGSYLKISFGFIPIAVCGILTGPVWTMLMAAVCDILGALLFPSGAFFYGFTLVAAAGGLIYGLFLYRHTEHIIRCMLCTLTVAVICNILLNTVFLIQIGAMVGPGNDGFWPVMWTRVIKNAVQFPVNGLILFTVWKAMKRIPASLRTI